MPGSAAPASQVLLEVRDLEKSFATGGVFSRGRRTLAARGVSFRIGRGESIALVGESGSGKSTVARLLLRLDRADAGQVLLEGADMLAHRSRHDRRGDRRRVQMVFQDPFASLNPAHDVFHHVARPLIRLRPESVTSAGALRERVRDVLRVVGLEPVEEFIHRRPYELSGGQRQRVAIARALAAEPDLLVADEPTSMLDVSIRMGILKLLEQLKRTRGLSLLLITHDLASARFLADRILVMYRGRIVEEGPAEELVAAPLHPYTRALLAAIADAHRPASPLPRAVPVATGERAPGCPFAARCPDVHEPCRTIDPAPRQVDGRRVRCHLYPADAPAKAS